MRFISLLFVLSTVPAHASPSTEWVKISTEDGVTTYKREIPNSPVVAFKGEAIVEDSLAKIAGVLDEVAREKEWMADLAESYNIEIKTESDRWEYNRTSTPWPLHDRDFVIHTIISFAKIPVPTLTIQMNSALHDQKPVVPGVVRGELMDSNFTMKYVAPNKTLFSCEILADPKGVIPKWVVNLFQKSWPHDTITGLRKQLQKKDIRENETVNKLLKEI